MDRLKPLLICLILIALVRSNQAQEAPLSANITLAEAEAGAGAAKQWMRMKNAGRSLASDTGFELEPVSASQSSTHGNGVAANCIDSEINPPGTLVPGDAGSICATGWPIEATPWLAIDYGTSVTVHRVEIFNRQDCCGERTRNVDVRISDELPTSGSQMFSGGTLLGHFAGPGTDGQHIVISGPETSGRYVVVQMDNGEDLLNLEEVKAFGRAAAVDGTCDPEQILSSSSHHCPGGPENSDSAWCSIFPASNIFSKDIDRWSKDLKNPANYWLTENNKTGEEQGFKMSLGCQKTVVGVNLRNTHNAGIRDRSTKKFRILGSADKNGPWQELLLANLEDSRLQDPPPFQQLMFPNSAVVSFVKFELLEYYGDHGGGLQFFEVTEAPETGDGVMSKVSSVVLLVALIVNVILF